VIAAGHPEVSVERRCELLGVPRASYYRGLPSGCLTIPDHLTPFLP